MVYTPGAITGTHQDPQGNPHEGYVLVTPSVPKVHDTAGNVILSGSVRADLVAGVYLVDQLPPTDDVTLDPSGFSYTVTVFLTGQPAVVHRYVDVPSGVTVDEATVGTPLDPGAPTYQALVREAEVSAAAALTSETNAASSAAAAATSETNAATSEANAAASATAAETPGLTGTGSPEGVVTATVGARYVDTLATNGAVEWIKATGSGNTGWKVAYGDTGWRNVTGNVINGWTANTILFRRIGDLVHVHLENVAASSATSDVAFGVPTGYSPATPSPHRGILTSANNVSYRYLASSSNVTVQGRSGATIYCTTSWSCTAAWPTTLPGTPA